MITLDRLEQKLDALAESQGKLLAALNDCELDFNAGHRFVELSTAVADLNKRLDALDAGLHETAMRNHQQIRAELDNATDAKCDRITLEAAIKHHLNKADAFLKLMTIPAPPRKARNKARRQRADSAVGKER